MKHERTVRLGSTTEILILSITEQVFISVYEARFIDTGKSVEVMLFDS